jgi:hypothetical protein
MFITVHACVGMQHEEGDVRIFAWDRRGIQIISPIHTLSSIWVEFNPNSKPPNACGLDNADSNLEQ